MRTIAPLIDAITLVLPVAVVPAHASASPPGFGPAAPVQTTGTATTPLPIDQVGTVLLDEAHGHLFISTGEGRDAILVTDLAGTVVHRFTGLAEPSGMVLTARPCTSRCAAPRRSLPSTPPR